MDKRLKIIASYIEDGTGVADVGTDHGRLPVELAKSGYKGNIIATDINAGPLASGVSNAKEAGVDGRIEFILCDGLTKCPPERIDTIVAAGMGGDMICHVLDESYWCMDKKYKLILQPMTKSEVLRYWLVNNGFEILAEDHCAEGSALYQIIVARFGGCTVLSDAELFTGKAELCRSRELYLRRREIVRKALKNAVTGLQSAGSPDKISKLRFYTELLNSIPAEDVQ